MINYGFLHTSIAFYEIGGFKRVESPWLVTEEINDITCPPTAKKYYVKKGDRTKTFVASGEQSFLYLINKGFIPEGKYQTITPCMRDDPFDKWHTKYFMKNELIEFGKHAGNNTVHVMISEAMKLFTKLGANKSKLEMIKTTDGYDIEYCGVELGSYGLRECEFTNWAYGTGLAEPRFSSVLKYGEQIGIS